MIRSDINSLIVLHRTRDSGGIGMPDALRGALQKQTYFVSTCMREFAVCAGRPAARIAGNSELERFSGSAAYAFLLQTVTGLNSSIPGETNIQGQVRKAWDNWRACAPANLLDALDPIMHALFSDARQIRRQYLQGIGGQSYGSLTRKLLNPGPDARVLFVGAGDLARSITPYFDTFDTAYWNRHATDAATIGTRSGFAPADAIAAANWATHVVLTTPPDEDNDRHWSDLLRTSTALKQVVHLGIRRAHRGPWNLFRNDFREGLPIFCDLDDIIELRQSQSSLRMLNIDRARRACDTKAKERASASLTVEQNKRTRAA